MKTTLRFLFIAVTGALMASCISNKRIVYLQDYSKAKPHNYLADTVFNATGDAYLIEQGDIIYVKSDHPEMSQNIGRMDNSYMNDTRMVQVVPQLAGFTVDSLGEINMPTVGKIPVAGMTIFEVQNAVYN
ncbi:MAG: polysaccharide biosynthesis/export family protein, partial [Cryomorphaceae bacterium]